MYVSLYLLKKSETWFWKRLGFIYFLSILFGGGFGVGFKSEVHVLLSDSITVKKWLSFIKKKNIPPFQKLKN